LPVAALVGYTNAGKSTLLNALTDSDVYVADQLFATLDPTTRRVPLPSGRTALMTDTVGFMQKLPTELVAAFRATLEEIAEADLLVHVVDVNHPDVVQQAETVERELAELGLADRPMVVAANKIDLLPAETSTSVGAADAVGSEVAGSTEIEAEHHARSGLVALRYLYEDLVEVSAGEQTGLDDLLQAVDVELQRQLTTVRALIPYSEGDLQNLIHTHGVIDSESYSETGTLIVARVPAYLLGSVDAYLVDDSDEPDTGYGVGEGDSGVADGSASAQSR
jgi:GTP-binding protein HflX